MLVFTLLSRRWVKLALGWVEGKVAGWCYLPSKNFGGIEGKALPEGNSFLLHLG